MSRVIETNVIKEEFDDVLETPLANFPFDFDVSSENAHLVHAAQVNLSSSTTSTASNNSSSQLPAENGNQNCTAKSNTENGDDSMTEDEEEEDNPTYKDRDDKKIKVRYLNCTQAECGDKLDTLELFHEHLRNKHGLLPLQCFCGCKSRFDKAWQISRHLRDRPASKFSCPVCSKVFSTQTNTNLHWNRTHLTGQFQCNIDDCAKVEDTRIRLRSHQQHKHCSESKRLKCLHEGCSSSFVRNTDLEVHQRIHLKQKPFHCKWPDCVHSSNRRPDLYRHIRVMHFKVQQKKGIVAERDPKKYVRVAKK